MKHNYRQGHINANKGYTGHHHKEHTTQHVTDSKMDGAVIYICPMCPEITQANPGIGPLCGMARTRNSDH